MTEIVKYDKDVAIIKALDEKYKDVKIMPGSEDDYTIVKAGIKEYRDYRIEVTNWHKVGKASILKAGKAYDNEKNKWLELITPGENKLKALRQEEDNRIGDLERKRISEIKTLIRDIELMGLNANRHTVPELEKMKTHLETMDWDEADFEEFLSDAQAAAYNAVITIIEAIETRTKLDREELERKAEADRLEGIRKEQEVAQAKIDEANKKTEDAQAKIDAQLAEIQAQQEALEATKRAEENRKRREAFEKQAKENAEKEAKEKYEKEMKEAQDRDEARIAEVERKKALIPDRDKLIVLADILDGLVPPKFKDKACEAICNDAMKGVQQISTDIRKKVEDL